MSSILTNNGAMVALQTMKMINKDLGGVQNMISTGKKVSDSKDNAAVWAISTVMKSDVSSFKAVGDSLALGQSTVAVARNASEQVTDLLQEMKTKIVSAQQENVDRSKIQADISALRDQVKSVVGAAQFNGLSLLKGTDDVNVLSSLDRSSNGSVSTSSISVSRNNLDSTNATNGTTLLQPTNAGATVTASLNVDGGTTVTTGNTRTLGAFTNVNSTLTFTTTEALDEGDSTAYTLTSGSDTLTFTYVQTAGGIATTTGEELARQISGAYAAFKADADIGNGSSVGDYNKTTGVYKATEGTLTLTTTNSAAAMRHLTMVEASGAITVTNNRDINVAVTGGTVTNRADANIPTIASGSTAIAATKTVNLSTATVGLQADDSYTFTLTDNGAGAAASRLAISVTGAALSKAELADALFEALGDFKSGAKAGGGTTSYANAAGSNATVSFAFTAGTAGNNEATFKALFDNSTATKELDIVQNASGQFQITNNSTIAIITAGALTVGSASTTGVIAPTSGTITAGTKGDYTTIDLGGTKQAGDKLSVSIAGVTNPITYTVTGAETDVDAIATNFMNAINTALTAASITDVVASKDASNADQIEIKNFNTSATRVVSDVSSVNELSLVTNASGSTIAAGATGTVTMTGRDVAEGDTYSITVGSDTVSYTAGKNDDLNEVGTSLSGLLKVKTNSDITVSLAAGTDPESDNVVLSVTNNGSSALTLTTTAKSGGTAGGGLELLDDIDVSDTSKASGSLDIVNNLIQTAIDASADFGSSEKRLEIQQSFIGKLTDSMQAGIGTLVDANMEETAARLQALQVQQQLGTQALSIANQAPQNILALFR